jgi:xylosylprotein 4-beta-galactosyltransferase
MATVLARALAALILASALVALWRGGGDHLRPPGRLPPVEFSPSTRLATSASPRNATAPLLCVVAPHRPREGVASAEPERFAAYLSRWLPRVARARRHRVWIVEQRDEYRFNRGWLLNVGVAAARLVDGCDVFALHDVDLLPLDPRLPYASLPDVPIHLSPPGIHPEYVYPTFRGGAWLFTWEQLLAVDGYSHAYWGWGQEDDDLGARLAHARVVPGVPFPYPGPRPRDDSAPSAPSPEAPCTGRANDCDANPGKRDCGRDPYTEHLRLFRDVPGTIREGIRLPPGRSLVEGSCFAHAHEGGFSRDRLETDPSAVVGGGARPNAAFSEGRRWADVRAGRFRRDETTGLRALVPVACGGTAIDAVDRSRGLGRDRPPTGHGFAVSSVDQVRVVVDAAGVASAADASENEAFAAARPPRDRWSGNAFLGTACEAMARRTRKKTTAEDAETSSKDANDAHSDFGSDSDPEPGSNADSNADSNSDASGSGVFVASYTRIRARFTCDEETTPWCARDDDGKR